MKQQLWRWTRGITVLGLSVFGVVMLARATENSNLEAAQVGQETHTRGHFAPENLADVPWTLAPAHAEGSP